MIVFLEHDQLIQTDCLIETFTHALNFANCYVESRQYQTLYATCTYPIMHLIPPSNLHNLCFSFVLGITAVQRKVENNAYANFWGANRVHYERCASGVFMCSYVQTLG